MFLEERRCWACGHAAIRTTFVGVRRKELHYCQNHEPHQVTAFRNAAFGALLRGNARRKVKVA